MRSGDNTLVIDDPAHVPNVAVSAASAASALARTKCAGGALGTGPWLSDATTDRGEAVRGEAVPAERTLPIVFSTFRRGSWLGSPTPSGDGWRAAAACAKMASVGTTSYVR